MSNKQGKNKAKLSNDQATSDFFSYFCSISRPLYSIIRVVMIRVVMIISSVNTPDMSTVGGVTFVRK